MIRAGAGVYYGRTQNGTIGSLLRANGQWMRDFEFLPNTPGSPVFPNVVAELPAAGATLFPLPSFGAVAATGTNLTRERQLQLGARFSF